MLMAVLCAVIAVTHAIRLIDAPPVLKTDASQQAYLLEWHAGFGKAGPTFRQQIRRETWVELNRALGAAAVTIPVGVTETVVRGADGNAVPIRVLDVNPSAHQLLPVIDGSGSADCRDDQVRFGPRLRQRLGLVAGQWARIGKEPAVVTRDLDENELRIVPGIDAVDAIRCIDDPFAKEASAFNRAILVAARSIDEAELKARLSALSRDDRPFKERWQLTRLDRVAEHIGQQRMGWLFGLEMLIAILAMGALVLLRVLEEMGHSGDAAVRHALGERYRHRVQRHLTTGMREILWVLLISLPAVLVSIALVTKLLPYAASTMDLVWTALPVVGVLAIMLACLRFATDLALGSVLVRRHVHASAKISRRSRPTLAATGLAALLSGAICVPASFMVAEFGRIARLPPGYETRELYSSRLMLLDYDDRTQVQWWQRLDALRTDVARLPGVSAVGYISPAPWDFNGSKDVVSNEENMILNVAVTEGVLRLLSPSGWSGRELVDQESPTEVIVQNLSQEMRRSFVPTGSTIIGEISGLRYSLLDETGRPAVLRSLRSDIGRDVTLLVKVKGGMASMIGRMNAVLARHRDVVAASPFVSVARILDDRMAPLRTSAAVSAMVAAMAVMLLTATLMASIRLFVALNRRDLSIRLCLGAPMARVQLMMLWQCLLATSAGWALGTMAGLALWHQIVNLIRDHRLVQPWSSGWLLFGALLVIAPYCWYLAQSSLKRITLSEALKV